MLHIVALIYLHSINVRCHKRCFHLITEGSGCIGLHSSPDLWFAGHARVLAFCSPCSFGSCIGGHWYVALIFLGVFKIASSLISRFWICWVFPSSLFLVSEGCYIWAMSQNGACNKCHVAKSLYLLVVPPSVIGTCDHDNFYISIKYGTQAFQTKVGKRWLTHELSQKYGLIENATHFTITVPFSAPDAVFEVWC